MKPSHLVAALFVASTLHSDLQAELLTPASWVTVGDPGNAADSGNLWVSGVPYTAGAVAESFRIMKFEFQNSQYAAFLNAVAATDPYSLYNTSMGSDARGGITRSGSSGSYTYSVRSNMGDKPVNFVSWFDAARVANWLHNGQGSGSTETGAYNLNGVTSGNAVAVNSGALYYLPNEDQWYKAAYYKGGSTNAGYWDFATQSDSLPTPVTAGPTGIGSAGDTGNFANWSYSADWNGQNGNVTTVGSNGRANAYGAFDMTGNVEEWFGSTGAPGSSASARGSGWSSSGVGGFISSSYRVNFSPSAEYSSIGFRLATSTAAEPIPEPGTWAGAALLVGGAAFARWRRRRIS
jgi:formylglycine-generating enzyme required for sulfatase activity